MRERLSEYGFQELYWEKVLVGNRKGASLPDVLEFCFEEGFDLLLYSSSE